MARKETSELLVERRLDHTSGKAQAFYRSLQYLHESVREDGAPFGICYCKGGGL
ncbi:MAG: hypothetical protein WBG02_12875 [Candidatus Acidiferrum sp.]